MQAYAIGPYGVALRCSGMPCLRSWKLAAKAKDAEADVAALERELGGFRRSSTRKRETDEPFCL
jgi:hypothetical protein